MPHREVLLSASRLTLTSTPTRIPIVPPMSRQQSFFSISIALPMEWDVLPPYKQIKAADGKKITVSVVLVDKDKREYAASILGMSAGGEGQRLEASFDPEIPKEAVITEVIISSDSPVECDEIIWNDWSGC